MTGRGDQGFVLWDVLFAASILSLAVLASLSVIPSTTRLDQALAEREVASAHLARVWEEMYATGLPGGFAMYNADPADDPGGPGTAPGATFDLPGYQAVSPDGSVGRIEWPTHDYDALSGLLFREDAVDSGMGMPRDLDGDEAITGTANLLDLRILPARIVIEWTGAAGRQRLEAIVILGRP